MKINHPNFLNFKVLFLEVQPFYLNMVTVLGLGIIGIQFLEVF